MFGLDCDEVVGRAVDLGEMVLDWTIRADVIRAELRLFFPDQSIVKNWEDFVLNLKDFASLQDLTSHSSRSRLIENIANDLDGDTKDIDFQILNRHRSEMETIELQEKHIASTGVLLSAIEDRRNAMLRRVLNSRIHGEFSLADIFR